MMVKTKQTRAPHGLSSFLKTSRGEGINYKQLFDTIVKSVAFDLGALVTTLPRGGLQLAQPQRLPEFFQRAYLREFHAEDRSAWQAIIKRHPVSGPAAWGSVSAFESSRYYKEFMKTAGLAHVAAIPLKAPVLMGYPGAIQLYRHGERGDFTSSELSSLAQVGQELDEAIEKHRASRVNESCETNYSMATRPSLRQFVYDKDMKQRLPGVDLSVLDERLQQQIQQHARNRMQHLDSEPMIADRLQLPDSRGDQWVMRSVTFSKYPALGDGPFVFFCIPPACCEWATLRPSDFAADEELSRMIPALKFMQDEYRRGPSLVEISKTAHLSPFHFHRRFTELLGLTPKHFMLDCQIDDAKRMLVEGEKELAEIAAICGFAHQSHFTSRFKQATGLTPTRWRRMARERDRAKK
jgi:AraC-like DNA-binding protein